VAWSSEGGLILAKGCVPAAKFLLWTDLHFLKLDCAKRESIMAGIEEVFISVCNIYNGVLQCVSGLFT